MALFKTNTKEFLNTLKLLKAAVPGRSAKAKRITCEITITNGKVTFVVPGCTQAIKCETKGSAKLTLPFLYFLEIVKSLKTVEAEFRITEGEVSVGILKFNAQTCFLRTIAS
ncbi:MAG: hypothetical protein COC01_06785 [Bacteroidetes bacterium]|nr:MAG: hypothetical protein COC01_06785 [Bacteroidota bacterium]